MRKRWRQLLWIVVGCRIVRSARLLDPVRMSLRLMQKLLRPPPTRWTSVTGDGRAAPSHIGRSSSSSSSSAAAITMVEGGNSPSHGPGDVQQQRLFQRLHILKWLEKVTLCFPVDGGKVMQGPWLLIPVASTKTQPDKGLVLRESVCYCLICFGALKVSLFPSPTLK